ncbi:hypothetical protein OIU76_004259 [Salix suchowensis]|nr:hypothetical protein OIU76_004259 [Salix suchowensis]
MAEGSVNFLISKLAQVLDEEGQLLTRVRTEAEYISDELEFMKAFLRVADAMEERDPSLEVLVKKVRDIAYDMEDALDDFKLRLTHDRGQRFFAPLQRSFYYVLNLRARHQIASRIRGIKSRHFEVGISRGWPPARRTDLVGIEKPKRQLIEWLLERKPGREVVSVVGMGGLGKSTLVKKVYDDPDVKKQFKFRAWITVSQSFKKEELLKDIIQQLFRIHRKRGPKGVDHMDYDKLRTVINKFLQQKKYLIVLDDVWHTSAWGAFQHALPNNNCGSRIMVTTRNTEVASTACMDFPDRVFPLVPLSQEESWILFCKKIFPNNTCPPHLKNISETILGRCEGLPLAIVSISGVLATKDKNKLDEWEKVHRSLGNPIGRMKLIRLWIAEGFVEVKEGMTLEEVAEDYLNELIKRSLLLVVEATSDGRVKTCRVHDLLREIMITKAKDQDFVAIAKEDGMMCPEKVRRVSIHKAMPSIPRRHVASRLRSVLIFWGAHSDSPAPRLSFGHLRFLNVLDLEGAPLKEFPGKVFSLFLLKYLSLRNTNVNSIPSSISKLLNLEMLDLKHTQISELPVGILKLRKLRHLLRQTKAMIFCFGVGEDESGCLSSPPRFLQRLYLTGRLQSLPEWLHSSDSLVKLVLKWSQLSEDPLLSLQHLPNLVHLELVQVYNGEMICFQANGFQRLKFLGINKLESLKVITVEQGAMPCLEKLIVQSCKELKRLPTGIEHLATLKVLEFFNMPKELIMTLQPNEEQGDYLKVAHVPDVYSTYWNNGILDNFALFTKEDKSSSLPSPDGSSRNYIWK